MQEYFKEYSIPFWKKSRFWLFSIIITAFIVFMVFFIRDYYSTGVSAEELGSSAEFFNISSQWIEKERVEDRDFKGIIMVPQISFQIRNIGPKELKNIYILGVFRKLYVGKSMGEGFKIVMKKGVKPGEESEKIIINSEFGYRATSKAAFKRESSEWGKSLVEIYIKSSSSKLFFIKSFYIRQIIEGMTKDVIIK